MHCVLGKGSLRTISWYVHTHVVVEAPPQERQRQAGRPDNGSGERIVKNESISDYLRLPLSLPLRFYIYPGFLDALLSRTQPRPAPQEHVFGMWKHNRCLQVETRELQHYEPPRKATDPPAPGATKPL